MNSEQDDNAADARDNSVSTAGARLRAAREALRLDLPHIAALTRIPLRHLEAIEGDNFESLPSRAYAIGFSRTFAKAVGLDDAEITDAVRAELADGTMRRTMPAPGMEPGDPARLPSSGLAWAGAFAALLLAVGAFAFYNAYFAPGTEPGSLLNSSPTPTPTPAVSPTAATIPPAANGPVVLTALDDGIWVRLYEQGGERLIERTLARGETVTVPPAAADPRINTGRPDALAITIGGQTVAKLSDRPVTLSGVAVSANALLARSAPDAAASAAPAPSALTPRPAAARPARRTEPAPEAAPTSEASPPMVEPATAEGSEGLDN